MNAFRAYPFIFVAGILQAMAISFMLVLFATVALFACMPRPLPTVGDVDRRPTRDLGYFLQCFDIKRCYTAGSAI